jgi:hypothetical protein
MTAARMLERWAASSKVNQEDWSEAMLPTWVADEIEHGNAARDVAEAVGRCLQHFVGRRGRADQML